MSGNWVNWIEPFFIGFICGAGAFLVVVCALIAWFDFADSRKFDEPFKPGEDGE